MATENQYTYYQKLCKELGQEHDESFQELSQRDASMLINELNFMVADKKSKDDNCYWYK